MSFRTVRNIGLLTLTLIVVLVSVLSYAVMYVSAQKLETVLTVEEDKLKRWQGITEVISKAKDTLYEFYMDRIDSLEPVMLLVEKASKDIEEIKSTAEEEELADIDQWVSELKVFRLAVYAYSIEIDETSGGGSSAKEMENAALDAANKMIGLNRVTADKIKEKISVNNRSVLNITAVSRKLLSIIMLASVFTSILVALFMHRALAKPIDELVRATRHIAQGDLTQEIDVSSSDEIGELSSSFNSMIRDLRTQKVRMMEQKDYLDSIIDNMAESLAVINPDGEIKTVNKATCLLLGYREEELIGENINNLFAEEKEESLQIEGVTLADSDSETDYNNYELHYKTKDGRAIPVLFSASALKDKDSRVTGIICVAQDITQIKDAENKLRSYTKKLKTSNTELRHFLHIASHDLQEPLRKVTVFGDRLKEKYAEELGEKGRDYLERMQRSTARMQTLINDLLTFSRLTTRARPFEPVDLSILVQEVLDDLETVIEEETGSITWDNLPVLNADPAQMSQLFHNIIRNALKFRKKDEIPVIRISGRIFSQPVSNDRGKVPSGKIKICQLTFEDNGIGFDDKYADRIFGVFQRLHGKSEYEGTGIGLSICRKIVERHEGEITAKGIPGKGSIFTITLPVTLPESVSCL